MQIALLGQGTCTMKVSPVERFWSRVNTCKDGCWTMTGKTGTLGYNLFFDGKRKVFGHRFSYEQVIGPIPEHLELDHLCRNSSCVRPSHSEAVTHRVNLMRGEGPIPRYARRNHCSRGHIYTPTNTYIKPSGGGRVCRICKRFTDYRRRVLLGLPVRIIKPIDL